MVSTIGILGAGQAGSTLARAVLDAGYQVVIANSRAPVTLADLADSLGPGARAAWAADAAAAADVAVLMFPYAPGHRLPVAELAGKVVIDNNNYMPRRDGHLPAVDAGVTTEHELRQAQLPGARLVKALSHIQFHGLSQVRVPTDALPALVRLARPAGAPDRTALGISSDHPGAVAVVTEIYDRLGFDAVDHSPLSESWRTAPGTPAWQASFAGQSRAELTRHLRLARRPEAVSTSPPQ